MHEDGGGSISWNAVVDQGDSTPGQTIRLESRCPSTGSVHVF